MNRLLSLIFASISVMQVASAQDSLTVKINHIDEYREYVLNHRKDFLVVKFPLNMQDVDETSCYIDYEKPDTLFCYFLNDDLVLLEHRLDRLIDNRNCDTDFSGYMEYQRAFFEDGKICLEEQYDSSYAEEWPSSENGERVRIVHCCYVEELRTYWDITIDKKLCNKSRSPAEDYVLETQLDSVLNATEWKIKYVDKSSFDYKYDDGESAARIKYLNKIVKNGLVLPEGLKLPYSK